MLLRDPQPDPEFKRKFNEFDTEREIPAMPKESSLHPSWYDANWQSGLPKPRAQQDLPVFREPLDLEKVAARMTWVCMGLFALVVTLICMGKVVLMVLALK
jgi:hypothetical protein